MPADLTLIDDVGAGPLIDLSPLGVDGGPTLPGSIRAGADLVTASSDKLIGASQGGIILGKAAWVEADSQEPLGPHPPRGQAHPGRARRPR